MKPCLQEGASGNQTDGGSFSRVSTNRILCSCVSTKRYSLLQEETYKFNQGKGSALCQFLPPFCSCMAMLYLKGGGQRCNPPIGCQRIITSTLQQAKNNV